MSQFMQAAIEEAKKGFSEGGIPIGSVLVGVGLQIRQNAECISLMQEFIAQYPELWNEDIGIESV